MAGRCDIIRALGLATHVHSGCAAVIGSNSTRKNHCRGLSFRFGGSRGRETGHGCVHVANPVSRLFRTLASAEWAKHKRSNTGDWAMVHCAAVESWLFSLEQRKYSKSQQNPLDIAKNNANVVGKGMTTLNRAAAADIGETSVKNNNDRSFRGRSGQRKLGVSLFTLSTRPSFFCALTSAGKGYSNPQIEEVTTW